jgi:hypothetical protein
MGAGEETNRRAEAEFEAAINRRFPDLDMRRDLMEALRVALERRGVTVSMAAPTLQRAPRMLWPATDKEGRAYSVAAEPFPPVDADLLLQVSPIAVYNAPGALNAYAANVSVTLALYEGRTKRFLGRQNVWFKAGSPSQYHRYESLVKDIDTAIPELRRALLSLVPDIVDIVVQNPGSMKP